MNMRTASTYAGMVAIALGTLYFLSIFRFFQGAVYFPTDGIEAVILGVQVAKLIAIFSVKRLRRAKFRQILDIWAVDILVVPALIVLAVSEGNHAYISVAGEFFLSWASAVILVFPPFAIYRVASMVRDASTLPTLLSWTSSTFAMLTLLLSSMFGSYQFSGLQGLARVVPFALSSLPARIVPEVSAMGVVLYISLILHSVTQLQEGESSARLDGPFAFALVGTIVAVGWSVLARAASSPFFDFGVPALVIAAIVWLMARGE